jgi:Ca2+-dependent lipid-binding protein
VHLAKFHTPRVRRAVEDALRISPVGRLTVTIKCARGLKNADLIGTSDPYVGVALGSRKVPPQMAGMRDPAKKPPADVSGSFLSRATSASRKHRLKTKSKSGSFRKRPPAKGAVRTKTVSNDLNPTFDETFVLDVMSTELQCVWIRVFDDDGDYNAHDVMGTVVLPLAGLPSKEDVRGEYALKSTAELDGAAATKSRGFVELALRYEPVEEEGSSGPSFEKNNGEWRGGGDEQKQKRRLRLRARRFLVRL